MISIEFDMFLSEKSRDVLVLAHMMSQEGYKVFGNSMVWREITRVSDNSLEQNRKQKVRVFRFTYDVYELAQRWLSNTIRNNNIPVLKKQKTNIFRVRDLKISALKLKVKCKKHGLHVNCARKGLAVRSPPLLLLTTYFNENN